MKKKFSFEQWFLKLFTPIIVIAFFLFTFGTPGFASSGQTAKLTIIHTNDIHAQIDDFAKLASYNKSEEEASDLFLYVDGGDIFSGNPVVDLNEGEPIVDLLDDVGLDVIGIGNHEFDYGVEALNKRMENSSFEWLSANMEVVDSQQIQPEPYHIFEKDGFTIGVLSLTQAPPATAPKNIEGIEFHPYAETVEQYSDLRDEVDVLIALNHIGLSDDRSLAEQFDIFDVIIGGHSHTTLTKEQMVNGTPIVQTGSHLNNIGKVTLEIDRDSKDVTFSDYSLQNVGELEEEDEKVKQKIDQYNEEMDDLLEEVIGETTGMTRDNRYTQDAPLGNFWTDAMREYVKGAEIALTNNGGIRASIDEGELTVGDIYNIEPFGNEIMEIDMTGEAIKEVIEYSYTRDGRNQIDLQTSGLNYTIITDGSGELEDVELTINGEPLEMDRVYKVAVPDYIGSGGSGYEFEGDVISNSAGTMTKAMIDYAEYVMEQEGIIDYQSENRIQTKQVGKGYISVEEAIADNEGEAFVVGYIVGHMTGTGSANFDPPFANDHNVLLADHPDETDIEKMLPVQITKDFRQEFGLQTNPHLVGTEVVVQGDLETYFTVPGLKNPKSININEVTAIKDVRKQELGTNWIIEGTVLVDSGAWGANSFYVHDGTGGILVHQYDFEVQKGDFIRLTGTLGEFNDEIQFDQVTNLEVLDKNQPLPDPINIDIDDVGEDLLGELVTLEGAKIMNLERYDDFGTFEFLAEVDGETVLVRVDNRTGLAIDDFQFQEGDLVDITGLVGIFRGVYQIKPRFKEDIIKHEEEKPDDPKDDESQKDDTNGKNGSDSENGNGVKPNEKDPPTSNNDEKELETGSQLPKTATMMWNFLLLGIVLLFSGSAVWIYRKSRGSS